MSGSRQTSSADGQATNSVAPFKERLSSTSGKASGSTPTKSLAASGTSKSLTAAKQQQQTHKQQLQAAINPFNCRQPKSKALQPISAVRAVAKVAAAEAAVSAAAAVLVPGKASSKQASTVPPKAAQHMQQQKHTRVQDSGISLQAVPAQVPCLQVEGTPTGPRRNSGPGAMRRTTAEAAATSSAGGSLLQASLQVSTAGGPSTAVGQSAPGQQASKHSPAQHSTHDKHAAQLLQTQELMQTLSLAVAGAGSAAAPAPSAAAQLAAYGLTKRIRAQLRSAHGPPPFQRSVLPRPASPPPVELDADMLMTCNPDAPSPEDVVMADLSSCNISGICSSRPRPDTVHTVLGNQQLSLQSFQNLVSLDLSDNRLRCFAGLAVLPSLQQLNLSANRLKDLQGMWQTADAEHQQQQQQQQPDSTLVEGHASAAEAQVQQEISHTSAAIAEYMGDVGDVGDPEAYAGAATRSSTSCLPSADAGVAEQPQQVEQLAEQPLADCEQEQQAEASQQPQHQMPDQHANGSQAAAWGAEQQPPTASSGAMDGLLDSLLRQPCMLVAGFNCLEVLDLSYNLLSGEQLLGQTSPLGVLPRLSELHAAGNSLTSLPAQLGPFSSLTLLNLQHNQLQMASIVLLGQLPVLQNLDFSHNPLAGPAHGVPAQHIAAAHAAGQVDRADASTACAQEAGVQAGVFGQLQVLDLSSSKVKQVQPLQELLGWMQGLAVLRLEHTPLAERCRAGKVQEQELMRPGLEVILYHGAGCQQAAQHGKHPLAVGQVPVLKIPEAATPSKVLAAASKAALVSLSHDQLVAAFDRVSAGIDNWQQLAPVIEEPPEDYLDWQGEGSGASSSAGPQQGKQVTAAVDDEKIEDKTFLTGVGITGELPDDESRQDATFSQGPSAQSEEWQDPTERLALALGLQVSQLAHMTGRIPGNPDAALHRLRHALSHPLVDPDAGHRPQQHHMRSTAATAAKQHQSKPAPLPQPISSALSTRVEPIQDLGMLLKNMRGRLTAMQGTLLPQLQAQANKMAPGTVGQP